MHALRVQFSIDLLCKDSERAVNLLKLRQLETSL